ncbi:DNA recombination protein RmuC [Fulvivirga sp. M361]|uniref:DNA recombination protein RmuC n=1 Tax=Fulvivirga sp. M361 TaxID=2594266 RepID=UPI00117A8F33|nr:DNA recombination protein RmuC [Fulvivirga sp. M361]TRX51619.1 DNA recombination protein RmuC [Fulvivirga sp. M361]
MEIIFLLAGLIVGGIAAWFAARNKFQGESQEYKTQLEVEKDRAGQLKTDLDGVKQKLEKERGSILQLNNTLATTEADYRNLQEKLADQKQEVEKLREKFSLEFKNLANEIFEEKSKKFTDQNKVNLSELLNPLKERITEFEKKVETNSKESLEQSTALREQLKGLKELNQQMTKEAENLTKALKGDTKAQGSWGEFILESILEKSGLEKGREYMVQESFTNEEGRRLQPDVIVHLPDNKNIVIDSKVSLIGYERYVNAEGEDKEVNLKAHILSIRSHIKGLHEKNYQQLHGVKGLDFVLMFIPIEPAFSLAVQMDSELFNDAYEKNIVIVSPTTLIATLRTISNIWKNEYQSQNALEIARQGGNLYDKFVAFTEDLVKVGNSLDGTQRIYREAMKKLYEGKGNLVNRAQTIKDLGAKASKSLDQKLLDRANDEA